LRDVKRLWQPLEVQEASLKSQGDKPFSQEAAMPATIEAEPLMTTEELARYLGVPIATLYQWKHKGTGPPPLRVGKHLRYRRDDVDGWLDRQRTIVNSSP
jgi:excisionase family DNA binding protein